MPANRWTRVDAIFSGALSLPAEEREAYVGNACAGDETLRREVEELLVAAASADTFFEGLAPPVHLDPEAIVPSRPLAAGHEIGPYRLVRPLGEGGMGAVYLAERADGQFERRVAIKLVQPRRVRGGELIHRFLRERQILARLQHPNIARLYDGGVTADGQPYLAMEYVEGEPITDYCDARGLAVAERVRLFQDVGRAVQHAHRNLTIHRDLKPSNILVTADGEVKLLDFGIAKLLEEEPDATATRTGPLMTPAYAAPEQVRGDAVTTATDVYALGVLLYELLTGRRPHGAGAVPSEVARAVLEDDPEAPSAALGRGTGASAREAGASATPIDIAGTRGAPPERVRRQLSGDLDRICLMALRKEPERRYGSAQALVDDLQRHLDGHPVAARPDTLGYRARKFVSRNRVAVAAAGLVLVSLIGGLGAAVWQAGIARREAATAREVSDFVLGLFEVSDPDERLDEELSVRDLLLRGADRIDGELSDQPEIQARMYSLIGPIFRRLGLYDDARPQLRSAVALNRAEHGPASPPHAASVAELGRLEQVAGNLDLADSLFVAAIGWYEAAPGRERAEIARVIADRARVARSQNRNEAADSLFRVARAGLAAAGGSAPELVTLDMEEAEILHILGRTEAADSLYGSVVERRADLPGERSLALARSLMQLGERASYGGDFERAEPLIRDAIALRRTALGERHRDVALGLTELAAVLWETDRREEALAMRREAVDILRETVGPEHPEYAMTLGALGVMVNWSGDIEEAVSLFRETERIQAAVLGEKHFHLAATRRNLGRSLMALGRDEEALPKLRAALDGWIASQGDQSFFTDPTRLDIARVLNRLGRRAGADSVLDPMLARFRETPPRGPAFGDALALRARVLADDGDLSAAVEVARQAIEAYEAQGYGLDQARTYDGGTGAQRALAEVALGEFLLDSDRYDEAEPHLLAGYEALEAGRGPGNRDVENARALLRRLYRETGEPERAARFADTGGS